jgi:hypothetical protein
MRLNMLRKNSCFYPDIPKNNPRGLKPGSFYWLCGTTEQLGEKLHLVIEFA